MKAADFGRAFVRVRRPNPVVVAWRWQWELVAGGSMSVIDVGFGPLWTVLFGAVGAAGLAVPYGRRWAWCVVDQHRVRTGLKEAYVLSRTGRMPMILWTHPVVGGERLLLLLRPGITVQDVIEAAPALAAAAWARDVWADPDPAHAHLVHLTVLRHDPST